MKKCDFQIALAETIREQFADLIASEYEMIYVRVGDEWVEWEDFPKKTKYKNYWLSEEKNGL